MPARTIASAAQSTLNEVQQSSRGGWDSELAGRALAAARVAAAMVTGGSVGQSKASAGAPVDGQLLVKGWLGRGGVLVSGSATPQTVDDANLASSLLARDLDVSRGLVTDCYAQLHAEGYLTAVPGSATRVAAAAHPADAGPAHAATQEPVRIDFRPGVPDLSSFPREEWSRAVRHACREVPAQALGYPDPHGDPMLRDVLAAYLRRVRGTVADPEHTVICAGFAQGLHLTRARTGVLIFVALAERHVEIIADQGINALVPPGTWDQAVADFVARVRAGRIAEGFLAAIAVVGERLAEHFPRPADDVDELPNRLIEI